MPLKSLFASKADPVILSYAEVMSLWGSNDKFVKDNDYTDFVFRTMGIGRIHHPVSATFRYLADPDQVYSLATTSNHDQPMKLHGSEGLFVTGYKTLGMKNGLALILRDQIRSVAECQPERHVVVGIKGINMGDDKFAVTGIVSGVRNRQGRITGLGTMPVTQEEAEIALTVMTVGMQQMIADRYLDLGKVVDTIMAAGRKARETAVQDLKNGP